jgi:hypothetical protein
LNKRNSGINRHQTHATPHRHPNPHSYGNRYPNQNIHLHKNPNQDLHGDIYPKHDANRDPVAYKHTYQLCNPNINP